MYQQSPLVYLAGVNPEPDATNQQTQYIIDANNARFRRGDAEKIGGHALKTLDAALQGCPRQVKSFEAEGIKWQVVGTHQKLYATSGSTVYNITPLKEEAEATLQVDALSAVSGSSTLNVAFSGHALAAGERIRLDGATDFAGLTAMDAMNREFVVDTVVDANSFTVEMQHDATSTASGGGAMIEIYREIDGGGCDAVNASGPGIGVPGLGLPGSVQTDPSLLVQPRIWWLDVYGDHLVCGAGQGGYCYDWGGDTDEAPKRIANAPAADWGWVEDAKLVVLLGNEVRNSDTGSLTEWSEGSAFLDAKEDATKLIGRAYANGENLIFADENKVFRMRWVGGTIKWRWELVSDTIGVVGPNCARTVGGIVFIFGKDNLYYYNGGLLRALPNNTLLRYYLEDYNIDQRYKFFVWYNQEFDELHFHYASAGSDENDRVIVTSLAEGWFSKREGLDRTAADDSGVFPYPVLASSEGRLYEHEIGYDDAGEAMEFFVQTAYQAVQNGTVYTEISGMELDMIQSGDVTIELYGKERARDDGLLLESFTVTEDDVTIECDHDTRWRSWRIASNEIGGFVHLGRAAEFVEAGSEF